MDDDQKTYVHSADVGKENFTPFSTLNITFSTSMEVEKVRIYFYRYGDSWCTSNVEICKQTWTRLEGIKISVGIAEQGDSSLIECGTVPEYSVSYLNFETEPEPLMKEVICKQDIIGNWVVIKQTKENEVLQFSEINLRIRNWEQPSRGTIIPYQWDKDPIQIKTDFTDSNTKVISFSATVDPDSSLLPTYTGISIGLTIRIPENVVEIENHHTSKSTEMDLTNMPPDMTGEVRWALFKLNRKLLIRCKGLKVWEMEYIKLFDTKHDDGVLSQRSMRAWSKTVVEISFNQQDTGTLGYRKAGFCFQGYYMTRENGCVECPKNTYSNDGEMSCTPCPDNKLSPSGTGDETSCSSSGYSIPVQTVLVNDYYPHDNPATDSHKPSLIFDGDSATFYHSRYNSPGPGLKIYFGNTYIVSRITFIPRYDFYLGSNENTIFTIITKNGGEENCGTLTGTNTVSKTVADQTYEIPCENRQGVGLKVWKATGATWCAAEITISYTNPRCTGLDPEKHKNLETTATFPVGNGETISVTCRAGYSQLSAGDVMMTCIEGTQFSPTILCSNPGTT
ncbi:hypothetical protein ACHWQZ_G003394 [Mnemiopsis leidyi]